MKKTFILLIACLVLTIDGCEKSPSSLDPILALKNELNSLANSKVDERMDLDPCNVSNPFDSWGEALFIGMTKLSIDRSEFNKTLTSGQIEFGEKIKLDIPEEYLYLDTLNVNLKNVELLFDEFLSLYIKRNIFEVLQISIKMESLINQSQLINGVDKAYLLKLVSLVRYTTFFVYTFPSISKNNTELFTGGFEGCWKRKLQAVEDSGFFQRLICVLDWPVCLGAIAADCLIEQL